MVAWRLVAWAVRMLGTQADVSLAWRTDYFRTFAAQPPMEQSPPRPLSSDDRLAASEKAKRRRGDIEEYADRAVR